MKHLLLLLLAVPTLASAKGLVPVRVDFLEALAPRDTTSSDEFRRQFESSVATGISLTASALASCGYRLDQHTSFYNASDTLQAREKAIEAETSGAWIVVGPRRSDHYILVAKGAQNTPSVSLMAGASEIEKLGALHLSVYATNSALAPALADIAKDALKPRQAANYLTVVSDECIVCKDFSAIFDAAAKSRDLKKLDEIRVVTESPDTAPIVEAVLREKPTFILLPNYSKVSVLVMASIQSKFPSAVFLGGDGWGDGQFGFVDRNPSLTTANGITVRGFPPVEKGLLQFSLGKKAAHGRTLGAFVPTSGPGMAILRIIQGTKDLLCRERPRDRDSFRALFERHGKSYFSAPWGVSAYRLSNTRITYWKEASLPKKRRGTP